MFIECYVKHQSLPPKVVRYVIKLKISKHEQITIIYVYWNINCWFTLTMVTLTWIIKATPK
jgi:hypothetical protein